MPKQLKRINLLSNLFLSGVLIGILFRIMNWPYAHFIIIISSAGCLIFTTIHLILNTNRKLNDYFRLLTAFFWILSILVDIYPFMGSSFTKYGFWIALSLYFITKKKSQVKTKRNPISSVLFITTGLLIFSGVLFKLMHWPYSNFLIISGFAVGILYLFSGRFSSENDEDDDDNYASEIENIGKD